MSDTASAFNNTGLQIGGEYARIGQNSAQEMHAWSSVLGARFSGDHLTFHVDLNPVHYTQDDRVGSSLPDGDSHTSWGNLRVGAGYRLIDARLGGLYRRGFAYQTALGIDLDDGVHDGVSEISLGNRLAGLRPFDRVRFHSGQYYEQKLEARYELIGCHAPFIHVSAGMIARKDFAHHTISVPASITIGAHPNPLQYTWWIPRFTLFAGYDVLAGHLPDPENDNWTVDHRVRLGVQLDPMKRSETRWTVPIRVEYASLIGASDGWTLGVYIHVPLNLGDEPDAPL